MDIMEILGPIILLEMLPTILQLFQGMNLGGAGTGTTGAGTIGGLPFTGQTTTIGGVQYPLVVNPQGQVTPFGGNVYQPNQPFVSQRVLPIPNQVYPPGTVFDMSHGQFCPPPGALYIAHDSQGRSMPVCAVRGQTQLPQGWR